jgi:HemX protein
VIHLFALLLYIAAFLLWLRALLGGGRRPGTQAGGGDALPAWIAAAGVLTHLAAVGRYTTAFQELPLVGLGPSLSMLALLTAIGLLGALAVREGERVGILLLPLAIVLQAVALAVGIRPSGADPDFSGGWFILHAGLGLAGVVGIALAGAAGWLYLAQFRELKAKRMGRLFHFLPPLATLDRLGRVGLRAGFVLLTLSLALGWAWTVRFRGTFGQDEAEMWWGLFSWLAILGAIVTRGVGDGPPERRAALANSIAFLLIAVGYLVLRLAASADVGFL